MATLDRARLGRCYELAGRAAAFAELDVTLVHGTIEGFGNPRIGHAWLVLPGGDVWEPVSDEVWDAVVFDAVFDPGVVSEYGSGEVRVLMVRFGHWGPWD